MRKRTEMEVFMKLSKKQLRILYTCLTVAIIAVVSVSVAAIRNRNNGAPNNSNKNAITGELTSSESISDAEIALLENESLSDADLSLSMETEQSDNMITQSNVTPDTFITEHPGTSANISNRNSSNQPNVVNIPTTKEPEPVVTPNNNQSSNTITDNNITYNNSTPQRNNTSQNNNIPQDSNNAQSNTTSPQNNGSSSGQQSNRELVLQYTNEIRQAAGASNLALDTNLSAMADIRAQEIVQSFAHTRPNGTPFYSLAKEMNISYGSIGENIAYGYSTAAAVVEAWKNSPGHYANMVNTKFNKLGVGIYIVNNTYYWVQIFTN